MARSVAGEREGTAPSREIMRWSGKAVKGECLRAEPGELTVLRRMVRISQMPEMHAKFTDHFLRIVGPGEPYPIQ